MEMNEKEGIGGKRKGTLVRKEEDKNSTQDADIGNHSTLILLQLQQNYNQNSEQSSFGTFCNLAEHRSYH